MISPQRLAERLPDFIDELRSAGYRIGVEQYIAAEDLLFLLGSRGEFPSDPARLRTLLGPLFCTSPEEQDDFRARFDAWLASERTTDDSALSVKSVVAPPPR